MAGAATLYRIAGEADRPGALPRRVATLEKRCSLFQHFLCDPAGRRTRLRAPQAITRIFSGPRAELVAALRAAEHDADLLGACDAALARLPTIPRRRVLATFATMLGG